MTKTYDVVSEYNNNIKKRVISYLVNDTDMLDVDVKKLCSVVQKEPTDMITMFVFHFGVDIVVDGDVLPSLTECIMIKSGNNRYYISVNMNDYTFLESGEKVLHIRDEFKAILNPHINN